MTQYEKLQRHIDEFTEKLKNEKNENLKCFYRNAIDGMRKKQSRLTIEQGGEYATESNKQER